MTSAIGSRQLRRIVIAYGVNRLGTWFGLLALLVAVFDHTHSALALAGLLFAGQALPGLIVPAVVARVEASKNGNELSALYVFEAVATAALAVMLGHFWLPAVLLLVALDGTAALAASALLRAELARVARTEAEEEWSGQEREGEMPDERAQEAERSANAALNVVFSTTFVVGPAIGGIAVASLGASAALFIDVGSFLLGSLLLVELRPDIVDAGNESVGARLRAAWAHINESASLRRLFLAEALALVFMESGGPIEVTYVKATLHAGDRGLGLLLTMWGAGAVIGSLVFARLVRRPLGGLLSVGTLAIAAAYLGLAIAPSLALACAAGFVGGIGNSMQWPSLISAVQALTPQDLQGRLMGAAESLGAICVAIGLPLGGALVALSSPRDAFLAVGIGTVLAAGALLAAWRSVPGEAVSVPAEDADTRTEAAQAVVGHSVSP